MYEKEIAELYNEIHSQAFGSEIDKAMRTGKMNEMNARAKVREAAAKAEAENLTSDEFVALAIDFVARPQATKPAVNTKPAWSPIWDRKQTNDYLRQHGYKWNKEIRDWRDEGEPVDNRVWRLRSADGRIVTVEQALDEIKTKN